jgi:thiosulfate/3-mercaptopyruvate sulfurtransferase
MAILGSWASGLFPSGPQACGGGRVVAGWEYLEVTMPLPAVLSPLALPGLLEQGAVLLDARPGPAAFQAGHLASAQHADLNRCLSSALEPGADPARGGRHPLPRLAAWGAQLGAWGITESTPVVAYDDANGGNGAARLWWMLKAAGHGPAALLEGGLQAALAAGIPGSTEAGAARPRPPYPVPAAWLRPTVGLEEVDRLRRDPDWKVLDVRARPRYQGLAEPIDPVAGHIPGALNLPFTDNLDEHGRYLDPERLRKMYLEFLDGTPGERLVVHCGSGVTACSTLVALELAGLPGAALYVGSWSEWCRNPMPREPETANS